MRVRQVGPDERAERAGGVGDRRRVVGREQHGDARRDGARVERGHGDAELRHRPRDGVHDGRHDGGGEHAEAPHAGRRQKVEREAGGDECAADVDGEDGAGRAVRAGSATPAR